MQENTESIHNCLLCDSPFAYTLSLISGKYKMTILYALFRFEVVRYNELNAILMVCRLNRLQMPCESLRVMA